MIAKNNTLKLRTALVLCLLLSLGRSTGFGNPQQETGKEAASELLQRFQRCWEQSDVSGILSLMSDGGRVIMRVDFLGLKGEYGTGQAEYILKEFFDKGSGNNFTISRYRELSGGVSAYAAGNISYRVERSGLEKKLLMFISLEERGGGWSVEELRINDD
jgi:hypothetical protein